MRWVQSETTHPLCAKATLHLTPGLLLQNIDTFSGEGAMFDFTNSWHNVFKCPKRLQRRGQGYRRLAKNEINVLTSRASRTVLLPEKPFKNFYSYRKRIMELNNICVVISITRAPYRQPPPPGICRCVGLYPRPVAAVAAPVSGL